MNDDDAPEWNPGDLVYTLVVRNGCEDHPSNIRLECRGWIQEIGIYEIQFTSMWSAAYFAQAHANGRPALLRVLDDPFHSWGERPIPPINELPIPSDPIPDRPFLEFFGDWPMIFQVKKRQREMKKRQNEP